ncbi:radical SAM protein [Acidobacteriota bacterium]
MRNLNKALAARMIARGTKAYHTGRPIAISFELTHSCTCDCRHCDRGGDVAGEKLLNAGQYKKLERELKPTLLQLSGGEPLMRPDLFEVIRSVKEKNGLPYLIIVSNASRLDEETYLAALQAGVNQFSISLDFPDERHDNFRKHPGLYKHLSQLIPKLTAHGYDNIVLNTAITRWNLPYVEDCYKKVREWGASISYSAYTSKRTGDPEYDIRSPGELEFLREAMQKLVEIKRTNGHIVNSEWTLTGTYEFFKNGNYPGCKAGLRYMVVNPDGTMRPCSMFNLKYKSREEMVEKFVKKNKCGGCYVAIRAYLSEGYWKLLKDNVQDKVLKRSKNGKCSNC